MSCPDQTVPISHEILNIAFIPMKTDLLLDSKRPKSSHLKAEMLWAEQVKATSFITNSYALVETIALVQSRLGLDALRTLSQDILPVVEIDWLGPEGHEEAVNSVLTANRRHLSLVDCSSFTTMRRLRIETVFTFDEHFKEQGFRVMP